MLRNNAHRLNLSDSRFGSPLPRRNGSPEISFIFRIPLDWKLIALSNNTTLSTPYMYYLYNSEYYVNFTVFGRSLPITYDPQTHSLSYNLFGTPYNYQSYLNALSDCLSSFSRPFFLKVSFKGNGYYMYNTQRNTIAPQMGYAHSVYVYSSAITVNFLSKTKILLFGLSKRDVMQSAHALASVKPINIFTGRGVRFARQVIYSNTGNVGAYR